MTCNDSASDEDEKALFHAAMRDVAPLPASDKVAQGGAKVSPVPQRQRYVDETASADNLSDHIALEMEAGDAWSFMRPGMTSQTLRRLRRGYWKIEETLDLHGFTRDEARQELNSFLENCIRNKYRCIRVVHGKGLGSRDHEPVLKTRVGNWLIQCADVLAFCQAKPVDGGGGAILILLKNRA